MKMVKSLAAAALMSTVIATSNAAVYVVAHPDDDVLMMGPNLINDIAQNYPTVIIVVTAGDAGNGERSYAYDTQTEADAHQTSYNYQNLPYFRVRLNARENALNLWIPGSYARPWTRTEVNFGASTPRVERVVLGNVTQYYLNLPDATLGNGPGTFMQALRDNPSFSTTDVRGYNTYTGAILRTLIRNIVKTHYPNTDAGLNLNYQDMNGSDHMDHVAVGAIVDAAIHENPAYLCMWQNIYTGYPASELSSPNYPNFVTAQKQGYEQLHTTLLYQGNVTPITGSSITGTQYYPPTAEGIARQKGTFDSFHTAFYGRMIFHGVASTGPCHLSVNG
jgi:LmbE family N-acetylglucosaminyl deacetylase